MSSKSITTLSPRQSGEYIAEHADHVSIVEEGIKAVAKMALDAARAAESAGGLVGDGYRGSPLHPQVADAAAVDWVFLVTTLNFNFWTSEGAVKYRVRHGGIMYDGYFSVCAAVNRALEEGKPATDPAWYGRLDLDGVRHLLRSDTEAEIPLLEERHRAVTDAGRVLLEKYGGSFVNCVKACGGSAQRLLRLVTDEFASYRDEAEFKGQRVSLYKRAQILIADLWLCFDGRGLGQFDDIDTLTMFADYRIPQALAYLGALRYSPELMALLQAEHVFASGHPMEVEIRGCSIAAVERIVAAARQMAAESGQPVSPTFLNSIGVDNFLWGYRRQHVKETNAVPYHKVRCIYY
ncbi:queuosine salvage protein-like [Amphibalanus amphitrite]|uniref:queuosine salvage protein-like n=1 Tax=Amphibalanus amphitrite TaxID=1232801 RepID=UPI001C8FE633|nr:queuosine salvage protein-like [Amphibalanus amphitrite]XP_043244471.1 queuosine salvage protein-like [Amphibalanus amphitrite]